MVCNISPFEMFPYTVGVFRKISCAIQTCMSNNSISFNGRRLLFGLKTVKRTALYRTYGRYRGIVRYSFFGRQDFVRSVLSFMPTPRQSVPDRGGSSSVGREMAFGFHFISFFNVDRLSRWFFYRLKYNVTFTANQRAGRRARVHRR